MNSLDSGERSNDENLLGKAAGRNISHHEVDRLTPVAIENNRKKVSAPSVNIWNRDP